MRKGIKKRNRLRVAVTLICLSLSATLGADVQWSGTGAGTGSWRSRAVPVIATGEVQTARDSSMVVVEHIDGLGRIGQTKRFRAGSAAPALCGYTVFDPCGRVSETWLELPVEGDAGPATRTELSSASGSIDGLYTSFVYEPTPLGREITRIRPGQERHRQGRGVRTEYLYNSEDYREETYCPRLIVSNGRLSVLGVWSRGELRVRRITDEDGNRRLDFTDPVGHLILERRISDQGTRTDLMHYYDPRGRLILSVPPSVVPRVMSGSSIRIDATDGRNSLYIYTYDEQDRPVRVSVPGGGVTLTVPTPGGRPALVQDGTLSTKGQALRHVYDRLGRHLYTGVQTVTAEALDSCLQSGGARSEAIYLGRMGGGVLGYTSTSAIGGKTLKSDGVLKADYWDDYDWLMGPDYCAMSDSLSWLPVAGMDERADGEITRGRLTGSARRLIGPDGSNRLLPEVHYYDRRGRLVQSVSLNATGGYSRISLHLSHDGRVLGRIDTESTPDTSLYTERRYIYTPELRLSGVELRHSPQGQWIKLTDTDHDAWGRVRHTALLGGGINVDYSYTPTGELESQQSEPWGMTIYRESDLQGEQGYFNGRIKAEDIRLSQTPVSGTTPSGGRHLEANYTYSYDGELLSKASYTEHARVEGTPGSPFATTIALQPDYGADYSHDADGNLTGIRRQGLLDITLTSQATLGIQPGVYLKPRYSHYGLVDDIKLSYEGGRLVRADDAGEDCTLSQGTDWVEHVQQDHEYTYDADGRMKIDKNKGVTDITYNALGLIESVRTPLGMIRNTWDGDGRLVCRSYGTMEWVTVDMGFTSYTRERYVENRRVDYLGELILEDGKVYRRHHEAGWTDSQGLEVAAVHDWRGSLRATWTDNGQSGDSRIYENLTGYYPYGLPWADWQGSERFLYGGKELEREQGLYTYDFHARMQDPALGRFNRPDPLAESYKHLNPYLYCAANPITYTDPTGCILNVVDEHSREGMINTVFQIFPKDCLTIDISDNNVVTTSFNKDAAKNYPYYKQLKSLYKGLSDLQNKKENIFLQYTSPDFIVNNQLMKDIGGCFDSNTNTIYICDNWDADIPIIVSQENHPFFAREMTIHENYISTTFHEFKEALTKGDERGSVIDYENNSRTILKLPLRPYDIGHKPFKKAEDESFDEKYNIHP